MGNGNLSKKRGFLSEITSDALDYISGKLEALIPSKMSQLENDGDFVSDAQYVHTDNNYTDAEQAKLSGIEAGAEVNTVKSVCGKTGAVALGKGDVGLGNVDNTADLEKPVSAAMQAALSEKADKQNEYGGFAGGANSVAENGGAVGLFTSATTGGAVGDSAYTTTGGAVGDGAQAHNGGGAVGAESYTGAGFAGGYAAQTSTPDSDPIDAIQLGTGWNTTPKTLQVYSYQLMDADGNIPSARIPQLAEKVDKVSGKGLSTNDYTDAEQAKLSGIEAGAEVNTVKSVCGKTGAVALGKEDVGLGNVDNTADLEKPVSAAMQAALSVKADKITSGGGFVGGYLSSAEGGAAVGSGATAFNGGAVGYQASVETGGAIGCEAAAAQGFSGGFNAKSEVDAIQLGTGTNSVPKTLQVYSHTVMNADGSLPYVHTARPYVETTLPATLSLNTIYDLGTQTSVTLKLPSANVGNFIQVDFLCGDTPATFTIDAASSAIVSDYDFTPEPDKAYSLFFDYGRLAGSLYGWRFSYAEYTYTEV